jgi:uncharacterized protein (TIGR00106 family)
MKQNINLAIQILPQTKTDNAYQMIDKAIEVIQKSGLKFLVCPFETVMEGTYEEVLKVVEEAQEACFKAGAEEIIVNIKIQRSKQHSVRIEDKIGKYSN